VSRSNAQSPTRRIGAGIGPGSGRRRRSLITISISLQRLQIRCRLRAPSVARANGSVSDQVTVMLVGDTGIEPVTSSVSATHGPVAGWIPWRGQAARDSVDVRERVKSEAAVVRQFVRHW
jgi:hypothetical protein